MPLEDIPLLGMLKANLAYNQQRQSVIATNVANADTPGFVPADLTTFKVQSEASTPRLKTAQSLLLTNASHIQTSDTGKASWETQVRPDSEVRLDGNGVVLEEQMIKADDAEGDFVAGIGFYQRSLELLHTAIKKPGS